MVDLDLLQNLLKNAPTLNSTENTSEEDFDQIVTLIEQEKVDEASVLIEKIFKKGIPDIRLIIYYFYVSFVERGIKAFADIFPEIISIVNVHWDFIKPQERKDKFIHSCLNWFFSHILNKFKYAEKLQKSGKITPLWQKSILEITPEELNNLIIIAREFQKFFFQKWPTSPNKERVLHLVKKIEELQSLIKEEKKAEVSKESKQEVEKQKAREEKGEEYEDKERQSEVVVSEQAEMILSSEYDESLEHPVEEFSEQILIKEEVPPSVLENAVGNDEKMLFLEKLDTFSQKLKVFELFISQNDYLKAAVVARDIDHLIESFDPLNYFPKLFGKYFSLVAKHVAAISEQYERKDTLQVKSLEKLYRTDLDMFVEW